MAGEIDVRVRGLDELAAGTRMLAANIDQGAGPAFKRVADQVAGRVRSSVPVRTGRLAGSVTARSIDSGASVSLGEGVPYATYVEFGGRGHPHSSSGNYLYPAAEDAGPQLQTAAERLAQAEIGSMRWPTPT